MKIANFPRLIFLLLPLAFGSGCATATLWSNLENNNGPNQDADLRLYEAKQQKDLLVIYDEHSERKDAVRRRAYFLNAERDRLRRRQQPHFVSTNLAGQFPPVPVFKVLPGTNTGSAPLLYALYSTNTQSFMLYSNGCAAGQHDLPEYDDPVTRRERIALTPLTVPVDLTLVGGCIFLWAWGAGCFDDIH